MQTTFAHESFEVWPLALDFIAHAGDTAQFFPKGRAFLGDQLSRASTSIALNIAEGAGEFSGKDKARFYRIALRSATECAAVYDVAFRLRATSMERHQTGKAMLNTIVAQLTGLAKSVSRRRGQKGG